MPATYTIDGRRRFAIVRLTGRVSGKEMTKLCQMHLADPEWEPTFSILFDASTLVSLDMTPQEAEELLAAMRALRDRLGPGRTAIYHAPSDAERSQFYSHSFGLLSGRHPQREERAFASLEEAAAWLNLSPADLDVSP